MTPNLFQGEKNPGDIPHVFAAIYRGAPCRFVEGFATKGNYLKGLGRDNIKMTTLTQTQEILFLCCVVFAGLKSTSFFLKKTSSLRKMMKSDLVYKTRVQILWRKKNKHPRAPLQNLQNDPEATTKNGFGYGWSTYPSLTYLPQKQGFYIWPY